jgi:hypothetical protein
MIVQPHLTPKFIDEFDIIFQNGHILPLTIDKEAGDTIDFPEGAKVAHIHQAPRPSPTDPDIMRPAEDMDIYISHILYIVHRTREVLPPTPEQQEAFKLIYKLHPTIQ